MTFQSTLPSRGATSRRSSSALGSRNFNPRSPRGERRCCGVHSGCCCSISIHAPLAGSDEDWVSCSVSEFDISIHAPLAGSDLEHGSAGGLHEISIHAPLAGSDASTLIFSKSPSLFQSTLPSRGATTPAATITFTIGIFQSTLPSRGATRSCQKVPPFPRNFNPRSPRGERLT